jgi:molybdenum cofactor biosynthesis enzyme MoaA
MQYYEVSPENNKFFSIVVDVTHRCNMACANCYIPNRDIPDLSIENFESFISKLTRKCEIRLLGGEPTLNSKLVDFISLIRKYKHRPTMMTNGLKLADFEYIQKLHKAGLSTINISLNGAEDDEIYLITDKQRCAKLKVKAVENAIKLGMFVNTNTILIRGVNEFLPLQIFSLLKKAGARSAIMRFRNVAQLGRFAVAKEENLTMDEMLEIVANQFSLTKDFMKSQNTVDGFLEKNTFLFPISQDDSFHKFQIKLTDWAPDNHGVPDPQNIRRGRLTESFNIAPFFEHVKANENGF